jgi:DNA invertase Pin-like site-specific DNA recombinase
MEGQVMEAIAYLRTSSASKVGLDKDSDRRQRAAVAAYAAANKIKIVAEFYDAAVSGSDPISERPGFRAMLDRLAGNGVRTILVESPERFARDLTVQLTGHDFLRKQGIALIPTMAPDYFTADTPTAVLVRQVLGAIAEFEKTSLVAKLRAARERKKAQTGKCGGRQSHAEARPEVVALVRQLRRRRPKGGQRSLREISAELAKVGHFNERGAPYAAMSIKAMLT